VEDLQYGTVGQARLFGNHRELWPLGCLRGSCVSCCQVIPLQCVYCFESLQHPRLWVMLVCCCHSVEVLFYYVHMRFMVMFNYEYLVVENDVAKNGCLSYLACLA
jgi:hypothetical protein